MDLVRAGVGGFVLIDFDHVTPGALVRNEYDLRDLGKPKSLALREKMHALLPGVEVEAVSERIGAIDQASALEHAERPHTLREHFKDCDLVLGCTGGSGVNRYLNRVAVRVGVPLVLAWVSNGAWGGRVLKVMPGETCLECMLRQTDRMPDLESDDEAEDVYERGCGYPTFTGAGFDVRAVAGLASRASTEVLLRETESSYPSSEFNCLTWSSRGRSKGAFPGVHGIYLQGHAECQTCKQGQ